MNYIVKKSKIILIILIVIIIISCLGFIFYKIDNQRIKNDKDPIFVINTVIYKDGGTKEYLGLGYKIIKYHIIEMELNNEKDIYDIGTWFLKYNKTNESEKMEKHSGEEYYKQTYELYLCQKDDCYTIKQVLDNNMTTLDDILSKAKDKDGAYDGGSAIYYFDKFNVVKCHRNMDDGTVNTNVYFGDKTLTEVDVCKIIK